jgi:hypothetical protein
MTERIKFNAHLSVKVPQDVMAEIDRRALATCRKPSEVARQLLLAALAMER